METLSHIEPINGSSCLAQPEVLFLADAFSEFISASAKLETSYANLQLEVAHLSHELADRNSALKASLAENERVHRALQQIVASMPCGVLVVEADGTVSMINPEARRLLDLGDAPAEHLKAISVTAGIDLAGFLKGHRGRAGVLPYLFYRQTLAFSSQPLSFPWRRARSRPPWTAANDLDSPRCHGSQAGRI
jgi:PAS domain-containing protein